MNQFSNKEENKFKAVIDALPSSKLKNNTLSEIDHRVIFLEGMKLGEKRIREQFGICSLKDK